MIHESAKAFSQGGTPGNLATSFRVVLCANHVIASLAFLPDQGILYRFRPANTYPMSSSKVVTESRNWLAWARLMRLSAVPTAATNVLMGYLLANGHWDPWWHVIMLCVASCCFYASGMVLNDYVDATRDANSSPERPIPAGKISRKSAGVGYILLTVVGLVLAGTIGLSSLAVGLAVVVAVFAYNVIFKTTPLAAPAMGVCRTLNVLFGASTVMTSSRFDLGVPHLAWWIAISLGVLITGLTLFARDERGSAQRTKLIFGSSVMGIGLFGFVAGAYQHHLNEKLEIADALRFVVLLALIAAPVCWRVVTAVRTIEPAAIRLAIISVISSLILVDASLCLLATPRELFYPIVVAAFIFPSMVLSRTISST